MSPAPPARLHLMPVPIASTVSEGARPAWSAHDVERALCPDAIGQVRAGRYFLAENARSARAFLKAAAHPVPLAQLDIVEIGHEPSREHADAWLAPLLGGRGRAPVDGMVLSESGCPGVADPGAVLVLRAHELGIPVQPWVGPSSLLLALMGAGLNGQRFCFLGYLPQDRDALRARLAGVQSDARRGETQIFIETPYRNRRLLEALLEQLDPALHLCVAADLMGPDQTLRTHTIAAWRALPPARLPALEKRPAVFLLG